MLNLYEILQKVLSEEVSAKEVNDAIANKYRVIINYSDVDNNAPKKRIIEPYAYGLSKAGNAVFRAFQYEGDTLRGKPKWKLFRLDRVMSWQPTEQFFNAPPNESGWSSERYNINGDGSMATVMSQVHFDDNIEKEYSPNDNLYKTRLNTDKIQRSNPINIKQMAEPKVNDYVPNVNKQQNQTVPNNEPIINTDNVDVEEPQTNPNKFNDDFQKMLKRNMDITQREKDKRGFNINNNKNNKLY